MRPTRTATVSPTSLNTPSTSIHALPTTQSSRGLGSNLVANTGQQYQLFADGEGKDFPVFAVELAGSHQILQGLPQLGMRDLVKRILLNFIFGEKQD